MGLYDQWLRLGPDTPFRARISYEILKKAMSRSDLVRVERTVTRGGKTYITHMWVLPDAKQAGNTAVKRDVKTHRTLRTKKKENNKSVSDAELDRMMESMTPEEFWDTCFERDLDLTSEQVSRANDWSDEYEEMEQEKAYAAKEPSPTSISDSDLDEWMDGQNTPLYVNWKLSYKKIELTDAQEKRLAHWQTTYMRENRFNNPKIDADSKKVYSDRFNAAPESVRNLFDKYAGTVKDCVLDYAVKGDNWSYYDPDLDFVRYNVQRDMEGPDGETSLAGYALFHEVGHLIDYRVREQRPDIGAGNTISSDDKFLQALSDDVAAAEDAVRKETGAGAVDDEVRRQVSARITEGGVATSGIQDIFCGVLGKPYPGVEYGHETSYWHSSGTETGKKELVGTEAFAEMYEASFFPDVAAAMEKWFPTAFRRFRELVQEAVE